MLDWLKLFINNKRILLKRIEDLEKLNENLIGEVNILKEQLTLAQGRESQYLDKLFSVVGLNKKEQINPQKQFNFNPIQMAKTGRPWSEVRANLEAQAAKEALSKYWTDKNKIKENIKKEVEVVERESISEEPNDREGSDDDQGIAS